MFTVLIHHLFDPVSIVILVLTGALVAFHYGRHSLARGLVAATALALVAFSLLPVDALLAKPLEDRYPRGALPARVDGIVVLSGGLRVDILGSRGVISDNATLPRMVAGAELARRYPKARFVFSGTSGGNAQRRVFEFAAAERTFVSLGLAPGRTIYERESLDTWENLVDSRQLAEPKAGENWVLVTSALHMPRAMGVARRLGWTMLPWPSDYESSTSLSHQPIDFASRRLIAMTYALHEWIGLLVYAVEGRLG